MEMLSETRALLDMVSASDGPALHEMEPAVARDMLEPMVAMLDLPPEAVKDVRDLTVPGPAGDVPARLYVPEAARGDGPVLLYFHGGGWVVGSIEGSDSFCRYMAGRLGLRVVSLGYRLAPEHAFPAAFDDCLAATLWVAGSPAQLGGKVTHVILAGDSAGGNLAAAVSGSGKARPAAQLLFYPVTDMSRQSASYGEFAEGYFLERAGMEWFRGHYLPDPSSYADLRVSPLLAGDLSMVPPTVVMTCGLDVLRDEGRAYAARLCQQGVRVGFREAEGMIHGLVSFRQALPNGARVVDEALDDLAGLLRQQGIETGS